MLRRLWARCRQFIRDIEDDSQHDPRPEDGACPGCHERDQKILALEQRLAETQGTRLAPVSDEYPMDGLTLVPRPRDEVSDGCQPLSYCAFRDLTDEERTLARQMRERGEVPPFRRTIGAPQPGYANAEEDALTASLERAQTTLGRLIVGTRQPDSGHVCRLMRQSVFRSGQWYCHVCGKPLPGETRLKANRVRQACAKVHRLDGAGPPTNDSLRNL